MSLVPELPKAKQLSEADERIYRRLFIEKNGYDPVHFHLYANPWIIATWKTSEVTELVELQARGEEIFSKNPHCADTKQFDYLEKLWDELRGTTRNTVIKPVGIPIVTLNVITDGGFEIIGKRSTGEDTSTNAYMNIGSGVTGEQPSDDTTYSNSLQNQLARKLMGSKATVGKQQRFSCAFSNPADLSGSPNISEAGINTQTTGHAQQKQIIRFTFLAETLNNGFTKSLQCLINSKMGVAS